MRPNRFQPTPVRSPSRKAFHERTGDTSRLYVVETRLGATADQLGTTGRHTSVSSPGDLTGIGMRLEALVATQDGPSPWTAVSATT